MSVRLCFPGGLEEFNSIRLKQMETIFKVNYAKCGHESRTKAAHRPDVDKRWHGNPRRQSPSSSKLDSITKGGDKDVTTRKTDRALVDKPDTTISPPGLHTE